MTTEIQTKLYRGEIRYPVLLKPMPNKFRGVDDYFVSVEVSDADIKELRDLGLSPKTQPKEVDGKKFLTFRRPTASRGGKPFEPPEVIDATGHVITEAIGNGSEAEVLISLLPYDNAFGKGVSPILEGVRVHKHVPYVEGESDGPIKRNASFSDNGGSNPPIPF